MEAAYKGETATPSRCGRMDQCTCMGASSVGLMYFDGNDLDLQILHCAQPLHFVVADLNGSKDTVTILRYTWSALMCRRNQFRSGA
jgi:galactokinase